MGEQLMAELDSVDRTILNQLQRDGRTSFSSIAQIHFCANSAAFVELFHETGVDVLSVDWRIPLDQVWKRCRNQTAVQGNLDPAVALTGGNRMDQKVTSILKQANPYSGHIFSLGHGVHKETNPENLRRIVQIVHQNTNRDNL